MAASHLRKVHFNFYNVIDYKETVTRPGIIAMAISRSFM